MPESVENALCLKSGPLCRGKCVFVRGVCVCVCGGGGGGGAQILGISKFCVLEHLDHYP